MTIKRLKAAAPKMLEQVIRDAYDECWKNNHDEKYSIRPSGCEDCGPLWKKLMADDGTWYVKQREEYIKKVIG